MELIAAGRRRTSVGLTTLYVLLAACGGGEPTDPNKPPAGNGTVAKLVFTTQPAGAAAGAPFATQPVVEAQDAAGRRVTSQVTISISLAGAAGDSLLGTRSVVTSSGVATFTDLALGRVATGHKLIARAAGVPDVESTPFDVVAAPATAVHGVVSVGAPALMVGDTTLVTVQITDASNKPVARSGMSVQLALEGGTSAGTFGPVTDAGNGRYTSVFTASAFGTRASIGVTLDNAAPATSGTSLTVVGFTQISTSDFHTCAVANTGDAYCWGRAVFGELGIGSTNGVPFHATPKKVTGGLSWKYVGAGGDMTCGLTIGGRAYCWGSKMNFSTGISAPSNGTFPEPIDGAYTFSGLAVGWSMGACGITTTSLPICWGANSSGESGIGAASPGVVPSVVAGAPVFAGIGRDLFNGCGITPDGTAYCWGGNLTGMLGVADSTLSQTCNSQRCSPTPMAVPDGTGLVPASLTVGQNHACALKPDGAAYCWGNGGANNGQASPPVPMPTLLRFTQFVTASSSYCGIATDASTYCWGNNSQGWTGTGSAGGSVAEPTRIASDVKLVAIEAGISAVCGLTATGRAYCWGGNNEGQLGDGTTTDRSSPTLVHSIR